MSSIDGTNFAAQISQSYNDLLQSICRLSSGLLLNSAKDDAAALAISDEMRAEIAAARQNSRNINDAISMIQTADSAAGAMGDNLVRMKKLSTQASSGVYSDQQISIMQDEFDQLAELNNQITETTSFNDIQLLEQDGPPIAISIGDDQIINIARPGDISVGPVDLINDPQAALTAVDNAINQITTYRADTGATANTLESAASVLDVRVENLLASQSRISDIDIATEVVAFTAAEIRLKAAIAVQSYSNLMADELHALLN